MTVKDTRRDTQSLTMAITTELDAPVERVWQVWEDPRQLERWWGPPTYPATFEDHDLTPGGSASYYMTGPEGDQPRGWWRVVEVEAPKHLEIQDGFADEQGNPNPEMPTMEMQVTLDELPEGGTRMEVKTTFPSIEDMERILEMGGEEGMREAMGQIDQLVAG